jgi:hypothetical protein
MTRIFQRIASFALIAAALSLSGCKTGGDTSLDKLVGSVSDAVSGQPSTPQPQPQPLSTKELCSTPNILSAGRFGIDWMEVDPRDTTLIPQGDRPRRLASDGTVCYVAVDRERLTWDQFPTRRIYMHEAIRRGFSIEKCLATVDAGAESQIYNKVTEPLSRVRDQLINRVVTPNQCAKLIGMPIPVPLAERKTANLCKEFKPFLVGDFTAKFKSGEISEEIQKRKVSPESCMKMAGLTPPKPMSAYSAQNLCIKFQPFVTSQFSVSFKSNDIAAAVKQKGLSPEACMKISGLTPPKALSVYDFKSICDFSDYDSVILKERKRRNISSLDCQITRRISFNEQDYLSKTPSKRVTPFLTDLDLCRFLKYKTPPHLTGESKKRGLRCDRLLSLDAFDRSVN